MAKHGEPQHAGIPCPNHHVERRNCHREGHCEGPNLKHEVPTRLMKDQELHLSSGGPQQGPGGPYLKPYLLD